MEDPLNDRDAWRVGVLFSQTGVTAAIERSQLNATLLAIDEINKAGGVLGRPIRPIAYDPASNPKQFKVLAERLLTVDRVRVVLGCYMSSTRKAVLPVVEAYRGLLFYPTLYEGFEYSPHCIYTGAAPNQNSVQLAKFLLQNHGNRFVLVGSNYIYPYESNRIMADFVTQSKGRVLDEIYVPLDAEAKDFDKAIAKIAGLRPDVVFSTVVGRSTAIFYEAYRRAGFDSKKMPIASLTTSEAEVAEMSAEAAEGHITAAWMSEKQTAFLDRQCTPTTFRASALESKGACTWQRIKKLWRAYYVLDQLRRWTSFTSAKAMAVFCLPV
jgi:branched-chain amino acid transport system substrate-binding protein